MRIIVALIALSPITALGQFQPADVGQVIAEAERIRQMRAQTELLEQERQRRAAEQVAAETIRTVCTHKYSIGPDNQVTNTTGEFLVTVRRSGYGFTMTRDDVGAPFTAAVSDERLYGEAEYSIDGRQIRETIDVNRFTGDFRIFWQIIGGDRVVHSGTCRRVTAPLF